MKNLENMVARIEDGRALRNDLMLYDETVFRPFRGSEVIDKTVLNYPSL